MSESLAYIFNGLITKLNENTDAINERFIAIEERVHYLEARIKQLEAAELDRRAAPEMMRRGIQL